MRMPSTSLRSRPDNTSSFVQSSPNEQGSVRSAPFVPPVPFSDNAIQAIFLAETRLRKTLGPAVLKRVSTAIEQVIKEIEDEVEDEKILLPRSVPVPRGSLDQPAPEVLTTLRSIRLFSKQFLPDKLSTTSLVAAVLRPSLLALCLDIDYIQLHRAYSFPLQMLHHLLYYQIHISTAKLRRESISSAAKSSPSTPVAVAPLFLQRSANGRYTAEATSFASVKSAIPADGGVNQSSAVPPNNS
ncbi:hypothetical protein HYPSUDRAFT_200225 [Hypholoma sublateritium FD-334 SS-4]|uniref:Uncharacterized protein n=1 Tax=Hypholoma sublateritium (strain FD-334 SS-4) TaxID=945553 RepID=A0A0D2P204_HYPSF|nr:hypothetical protein HYPSUDRAFT_200225 [Hypholoma sublateritium FD-334 SS-4]